MFKFAIYFWIVCAFVIGIAGCANTTPPHTSKSGIYLRKANDFHYTKNLTLDQVTALWGPPDGHRGSGIRLSGVGLPDGKEVSEIWLAFGPDKKLWGATLLTRHRKHLM
jgi:hypothetical protein